MTYYKFLNLDGTACHGGSGKWFLPNGKPGMTSDDAQAILCAYTGQPARYLGWSDEEGWCFECREAAEHGPLFYVTPDCCIWNEAGALLHEDGDACRELEREARPQDEQPEYEADEAMLREQEHAEWSEAICDMFNQKQP